MYSLLPSRIPRLVLLLTAVVTTGCASLGDVATPRPAAVPDTWQARLPEGPTVASETWWPAFGQPELVRLLETARNNSPDWRAARARIAQARAQLAGSQAAQWPTLGLEGSASSSRFRQDGQRGSSDSRQAGLTVNYELDLWGRLSAQTRAAEARLASSDAAAAATWLVLETDIASAYFQLASLNERIALTERTLTLLRTQEARSEDKRRLGAATLQDVAQQRQLRLTQEAALEALRAQAHDVTTALAVWVGATPQGFSVQPASLNATGRPLPAPLQPAMLLVRRPDLREAEAALAAADANVAAARAAFYPSLSLSARGVVSTVASGGTDLLASLAGSLSQALFDGGARNATLAETRARREELVAAYRKVVLTALKEGEDALAGVASSQARAAQSAAALEAARTAYRMAEARQRLGALDPLGLLEAERTLISSETADASARLEEVQALVSLYKALGGAGQGTTAASAG